jgi:hypothetical protein
MERPIRSVGPAGASPARVERQSSDAPSREFVLEGEGEPEREEREEEEAGELARSQRPVAPRGEDESGSRIDVTA